MKLLEAQVRLFRNIVDSNSVSIDDHITCMVGKNESGKTAFLKALYSLNPAYPSTVEVDIIMDYPRWRKVRDERKKDLGDVELIEAIFELNQHEIKAISSELDFQLPNEISLIATRNYSGAFFYKLRMEETEIVRSLMDEYLLDENAVTTLPEADTLEALLKNVKNEMKKKDGRSAISKSLSDYEEKIRHVTTEHNNSLSGGAYEVVKELLPKFFYFSEYSPLQGRIDLTTLIAKNASSMTDDEHTAMALLDLVGVQGQEFMETDFEVRIAELEAAANEVTRQVFDYWTQNPDLIVDLQGDSETISTPEGQKAVHRYLDIRLNDLRHQMTTNFETRSSGFQWFFSFIVAFSRYENDPNVIILLDEPGLGLHARAQADLLDFIEKRLSVSSQVIYTSHSPFLVNPKHLNRARLVEDLSSRENPDTGSKVSIDVLTVRKDTLFPLQASLGYDLAQNLFIGPYNLVVEGPSDLLYLTILSGYLETQNRPSLDDRFTIVPVGGAEKIPTFVALLGVHLDVSVLIDDNISQNQRLRHMVQQGLLSKHRIIGVSQITQDPGSNIEDLFNPSEYLMLYNSAFSSSLNVGDLKGTDSIIQRLERHIGSKFNHLNPANILLQDQANILSNLAESTLQRFESLFSAINKTIS